MTSATSDLHRIIVVGGGAGGLELVTRLGNKLGRYKRADVTLVCADNLSSGVIMMKSAKNGA